MIKKKKVRARATAAREKVSDKIKIRRIQRILGVPVDGIWGPVTQAALDDLIEGPAPADVHRVIASSFADPADVRAFEKCKAQGKTDQQCFKVGDNGIGCWGDSTKEGTGPSCALPPEDMEETWSAIPPSYKEARFQSVKVVANNQSVFCELKDRMPHRKNIKNGAGIDLNPDACAALGLKPPVKIPATWEPA
jgi:hypothetical protein